MVDVRQIVIANQSTKYSDAQFRADLLGLEAQLNEDVASAWGLPQVKLHAANDPDLPADIWGQGFIKDVADDPDDLGFHLLDNGVPEFRVFVDITLSSGNEVSTVLSHELIEMVVDPNADQMVMGTYVKEACDPVEETYYQKAGVLVSNFVLPAYWDTTLGNRYDWNGQLTGACPNKLPGGYDLKLVSGQWNYEFADHVNWRQIVQLAGRTDWRKGHYA